MIRRLVSTCGPSHESVQLHLVAEASKHLRLVVESLCKHGIATKNNYLTEPFAPQFFLFEFIIIIIIDSDKGQ
jgi:hypothetical protein